VTIVYLIAPASRPDQVNRVATLAQDLGDHSDGDDLIAFPTFVSTADERIRAVCDAGIVVFVAGWEFDADARHDAQVAVWCRKMMRVASGLRLPSERKGRTRPELKPLSIEAVAAVLDRGMQSPLVEPADGEAVEGSG